MLSGCKAFGTSQGGVWGRLEGLLRPRTPAPSSSFKVSFAERDGALEAGVGKLDVPALFPHPAPEWKCGQTRRRASSQAVVPFVALWWEPVRFEAGLPGPSSWALVTLGLEGPPSKGSRGPHLSPPVLLGVSQPPSAPCPDSGL